MPEQNHNSETSKLHSLIDDLCDSSITSENMDALNQCLESDAFSRREYLDHVCLEAQLCCLYHQTDRSDTASEATSTPLESHEAGNASRKSFIRGWNLRQTLTLAATIALVALGSSWLVYEGTKGRGLLAGISGGDDLAGRPDAVQGPVVARISGTRNCLWRGDDFIGYGSDLIAGQLLELEAGIAEVTFAGGTRVVLEGPSSFRVPDAENAELLAGRMAASIPHDSTKFSISTPRFVVSDSGAQFGLIASSNGDSEVHVFEGSVRALLLDEQGHTVKEVELADRDAARLVSHSTKVTFLSADASSFVRTLASSTGPAGGLLAIEEFDYPVGPLASQNGGFGWAGPWADIEAASDSLAPGAAKSNGVAEVSLAGCDVLSRGNRACQTGQANRIRRTLSTSLGGVFDVEELIENQDGVRLIGREGKTVYLSFLQRVSRTDDVFYGLELHRGDGNFNRVFCIGNSAEGSGYGVTSNFNSYLGEKCELLGAENTDTNFFVVRIEFRPDNQDLVTVFRNPSSLEDESQCVAAAELRGNFAFDRVSLANFEGSKTHEVDEIRVGTSFRAVTVERGRLEDPLATYQRGERLRVSELRPEKMGISADLFTMLLGVVCF
jgi:hypothetical protein